MKEKADRDEQLAFETRLKNDAAEKKRRDEADLVGKIVNEMEQDQIKFERYAVQCAQARQKLEKVEAAELQTYHDAKWQTFR